MSTKRTRQDQLVSTRRVVVGMMARDKHAGLYPLLSDTIASIDSPGSGLRSGCFRCCIGKGFDRRANRIDMGDLRKRIERYVETPRVVDLRHQSHIRQARLVAKAEGFPLYQAFNRAEAFLDPVPVPGVTP
jgi:hypothetical protein